jgi:hypothetical protein
MEYLAMILKASEYDGSYIVGGPKKSIDDGKVPDRETFWLVERKVSPPQYVGGIDWTMDVWQARRFKNEREAHDHWRTMRLFRDESAPVEHMFINKP